MKIAVVTDSTAYLNKEQVEKYNIRVVPIPFIIDDKVYNEGLRSENWLSCMSH